MVKKPSAEVPITIWNRNNKGNYSMSINLLDKSQLKCTLFRKSGEWRLSLARGAEVTYHSICNDTRSINTAQDGAREYIMEVAEDVGIEYLGRPEPEVIN